MTRILTMNRLPLRAPLNSWGPRAGSGLALALLLAGCLSPSGRLGDDPALGVERERAEAFDALEAAATVDAPRERLAAERALRPRFALLVLRLPDDAELRAASGALALRAGDRIAAERELAQALRRDPGHVAAAVLYARLAAQGGDLAGARGVLATARLLVSRAPEPYLAAAQVESLDGDPEQALALLDRARSLGAEPWRVELDRSVVLEFADREEEASIARASARALAPDPDLVPEPRWRSAPQPAQQNPPSPAAGNGGTN